MSNSAPQSDQASDAIARLDALLQHPSRLGACVLASTTDAISFTRLKSLLKETDGNLGAQLRKLEDEGYLAASKEFQDRKPVTWYSLTAAGRKALRGHLAALEALISASKT